MKNTRLILVLLGMILLVLSPAWQTQEKKDIQAVLVKVVRDVEKKGSEAKAWTKALSNDQLKAGYEIKTLKGSAALISFLDNSKIVVRENSLVQIKGQVQGKQIIDRDVYMERGKLQFEVKKQEAEQFRFTSPISVASIRGTGGEIDSYGGDSAWALCTHGSFDFANSHSHDHVIIDAGHIGFTYGNGSLTWRPANQNELGGANTNLGGGQDTSHTGGNTKDLIIYGEDQNGQPKRIVIKIQQ